MQQKIVLGQINRYRRHLHNICGYWCYLNLTNGLCHSILESKWPAQQICESGFLKLVGIPYLTLGNYPRISLSGSKLHFNILRQKGTHAECFDQNILLMLFSHKVLCSLGNCPRVPRSGLKWHFSILGHKSHLCQNVFTSQFY